jgi:hypothetical protein
MWQWSNSTGTLTHDGAAVATGYAGHGAGKNNPQDEAIPDTGPPPEGLYTIGPPRTDPHLGPVAMPLSPAQATDMHGRSGFWLHADNPAHPGQSSEGCIVLSNAARQAIASSGDTALTVRA